MDFSSKADRIEKMAQYWGAFLFCAVLVSCASSKPRGQVLPLHAGEMEPRKTARAEETVRVQEGYALSEGKGTSLPVPTNPEEAAIFYFGLGQAYSLDNEPAKAIESYRATLVHDPQSPLVRARLAAELVKVGNFAEAKVLCEEAVRLDPKYLDSYLLLAGIQVAAKEYDTAISTYRKVIAIDPKNRDALLYLGVTLAEVGKAKEGLKELEKLVRIKDSSDSNIDQSVAFYYLAKINDQAGQKDQAIKAYRASLSKRPGFAKAALSLSDIHLAQHEMKKAYSVLEEAFAESRSAEIAERLAEHHLEQNDYKGAVRYLEALTEEDPSNENMKLRLALVYWQIQWFPKAQALLSDLHARYPSSSEISFYLGELFMERGDFPNALVYFKKVSADYAKYDQVVSRVVTAFRQQGKLSDAEGFLLSAVKARPDLVSFYPLLAAIYEDQKKVEDSRIVLERAEKLFPNDENILYYLGFTLDRMGEKQKALAKMEKLLTINANNANALNFVGYSLLELGTELEQAKGYLEKAVKLKPEDAFILDSYGWLLYRLGKRNEAMKQLEKAFASKPEEAVIGEHLADVYVSLNMPRKAMVVYERILKGSADKEFQARVQEKMENVRGVLSGSERAKLGKSPETASDSRSPSSK